MASRDWGMKDLSDDFFGDLLLQTLTRWRFWVLKIGKLR